MIYLNTDIYFSISIILLFIGSVFTTNAIIKSIKFFKVSNFLIRSFITISISDSVCILNFLSRTIYNLIRGKLDTSIWCNLSAIFAVAHFCTLFCGHLFVSYCTYQMTLGKNVSDRKILIYNVCFWLFGIGYGLLLNSYDVLGNFEGLYCCILRDKLSHALVNFIVYICIFLFLKTTYYYILAYKVVKVRRNFNGIQHTIKKVILKRGMMFFISFIFCWSLMIYKLICIPFNNSKELNLFLEMLSAWLVKCMPILNSMILLKLFHIIEEKEKIESRNVSEILSV